MITIDASVFISAALADEAGSSTSGQFLASVAGSGTAVICPCLLLPEVAAGIARRKDDARAAVELAETLPSMIPLALAPIDENLAWQAARLAADHRLRGADSVYVAVAKEHGAVLITWDREQLNRVKTIVPVGTPEEFILDPENR